MKLFRHCISLLAFGLLLSGAPDAHAADAARVHAIAKDLRCLTCPNENVAESQSPMALDVKDYIATQLDKGDDQTVIVGNLVARYGEQILYKPLLVRHNFILWLMPLMVLAGGAVALMRVFRVKGGQA